MRIATIALACGLLALAPGCGGDDEEEPVKAPTLTVPGEREPDTTERQDTATTETDTAPAQPESGGQPAPEPQPEDSPQNDTPPPAGSPAERFEQFCEETQAPAASRLQTGAVRRPRSLACWCRLRSLRPRPAWFSPALWRLGPAAAPAPGRRASAPVRAGCWAGAARGGGALGPEPGGDRRGRGRRARPCRAVGAVRRRQGHGAVPKGRGCRHLHRRSRRRAAPGDRHAGGRTRPATAPAVPRRTPGSRP